MNCCVPLLALIPRWCTLTNFARIGGCWSPFLGRDVKGLTKAKTTVEMIRNVALVLNPFLMKKMMTTLVSMHVGIWLRGSTRTRFGPPTTHSHAHRTAAPSRHGTAH